MLKKVETIQNEIVAQQNKLDNLLKLYNEKIPSMEEKIAENHIKIAKKISASTTSTKYGKRQLENIGTVIVHLLDQAFCKITPDEEAKQLYDAWADSTYEEEAEAQMAAMRKEMEDLLRSKMGFDVDLSDFEDTEDYLRRFHEKMQEELEKMKAKEAANLQKEPKKTKKQLEKELRLKEEENTKLKSVRSIYISLAKVLHPDTENAPEEKAMKEELMKRLTVAYQEKDLPTLLKLEMEWVAAECNNVEKLCDDKLKLYILSLKEQVSELEDEYRMIANHPRYECISEYTWYAQSMAIAHLNGIIQDHKIELKALETLQIQMSQPNAKKLIIQFVNQSVEMFDEFDIFDDSMMPW